MILDLYIGTFFVSLSNKIKFSMRPPQQHNITLPAASSRHQKPATSNSHPHLNGSTYLNSFKQPLLATRLETINCSEQSAASQQLEHKNKLLEETATNTYFVTCPDISTGDKYQTTKLPLTLLRGTVCPAKQLQAAYNLKSNETHACTEHCQQPDASQLFTLKENIYPESDRPMTTDQQCGLGSFFPMSCRGRAEAFARRLHIRLRSLGAHDVGSGSGSHTSSPDTEENSWLAANEAPNPVTNLQPRHSTDSEIFFDLGIFESPGSPIEEIPESEFARLITNQKDELPVHETCQCSGSTTKVIRCSDPDSGYSFSSPVTEETPGDSDTSEYFDTENTDGDHPPLQCANRKPTTLRTSEHGSNIKNELKTKIHRQSSNSPKGAQENLVNGLPELSPQSRTERTSSILTSPVNIIVNPLESATFCDENDIDDISSLIEENDSLSNCTECSISSIVPTNVSEERNDDTLGKEDTLEKDESLKRDETLEKEDMFEKDEAPDKDETSEIDETIERDDILETVENLEKDEMLDVDRMREENDVLEEKKQLNTSECLQEQILKMKETSKTQEEYTTYNEEDDECLHNIPAVTSEPIVFVSENCNKSEDSTVDVESNNNEIPETYCCSINISNDMTVTLECVSTVPQVEVTSPVKTPIENETEAETCVAEAEVIVEEIPSEDKSLLCESSIPREENDKSSSDQDDEETEERIPRVRRCSSLKTGKTPPGTPGRKKIVRFADVLGLDLADVRTFLDEIPKIPTSAFVDLVNADISVGSSQDSELCAVAESQRLNVMTKGQKPDKILVPLFQQPGGQADFIDKVRERQCCLENACIQDAITLSIAGTVRVRNLDFHKSVHIRYSTDSWKNFADLQATYVSNSCDGFSDKFSFLLYAHNVAIGQRIEFAVRFQCKGCQYWDNNDGANYCFQCLPSSSHTPYLPITGPEEHWDGFASFY